MAKLTAALCLSCASAMVYTNPTSVTQRRTGVSFLPVQLQSGNSKETFAKFVARTHRERSAQRDTIKVPRHRSAARCHICRDRRVVCPEKKVGHPRAGLAGRACAASGPRVGAGCWRARQLRVFTGRELVAGRASGERSPGARARRRPRARRERSPGERWVLCRALGCEFPPKNIVATCVSGERSPGARESGKKRPKVTRHAPRRIPRSSAPRRATRSSRASSRRTRRTRGPICMTSRRRFAPVP